MSTEVTIIAPDSRQAEAEAGPLVASAAALTVQDEASHRDALNLLRGIAGLAKRVKDAFADPKAKAHAAHKSMCSLEARFLTPLEGARRGLEQKALRYSQEEKRRAREEQERAAEEARKAAEETKIAEAIAADERGDVEEAAAILEEPVIAPVAPVVAEVARDSGVKDVTRWRAEVTDLHALIRYVAAHPQWTDLLLPNLPRLHPLARSQRDKLSIPGVRAVPVQHLAVSAAEEEGAF